MGHRQDMTHEQRFEWDIENYKKRLKARIGRNYPYWNDRYDKMLDNGWELYQIVEKSTRQWSKIFKQYATSSEEHAKKIVCELREKGYRANIVCGYEQNRQRVKMYSIIIKQTNHQKHE